MNFATDKSKTTHWVFYVLLLVVFYFTIFYRLDTKILREWDEARNAMNAVEMIENGNPIIRYYEGVPDMWEVKPPLLTWFQVITLTVFGKNELGVRLPSAIAALLLAFALLRVSKTREVGILSSLILVTSTGYIGEHIARTGDHDSLMVLLMFLGFLSYFKFLETFPKQTNFKWFWVFICFLLLGFMTKSIASFMFLPGMFIYTLYTKKLIPLFKTKELYIGIIVFVVVVGTYYFYRETYSPGYLKVIWRDELFPRYFNTQQAFHKKPFLYYVSQLFESRFFPWAYFLFPALVFQWWIVPKERIRLTTYFSLTLVLFLIIISKGTYNFWYDAPAYPLMAFLIGQFIFYLLHSMILKRISNNTIRQSIFLLLLYGLFIYPFNRQKKKNMSRYEEESGHKAYSISYMIRDFQENNTDLPDTFQILYDGHSAHLQFYVASLKTTHPHKSVFFKNKEDIKVGDKVAVSQQHYYDYLRQNFELTPLHKHLDATVFEVLEKEIPHSDILHLE